jgi:integrase
MTKAKDKEVGFMLNPEEKKAQLGFKMKFDEGGFLGKYQSKGTVIDTNKTITDVMQEAIIGYNKAKNTSMANKVKKSLGVLTELGYANVDAANFNDRQFLTNLFLEVQDNINLGADKTNKKLSLLGTKTGAGVLQSSISVSLPYGNISQDAISGIKAKVPPQLEKGFFGTLVRVGYDFGDETTKVIYNALLEIPEKETRAVAILKAFTGLRTEDLANLDVDDFNYKRAELTNIGGKKGKTKGFGKSQTIPNIVREALLDIQNTAIKEGRTTLFSSKMASNSNKAAKVIQNKLAQNNLSISKITSTLGGGRTKAKQKFTFGMFRNLIGRVALDTTGNMNVVSTVLGHTKATATSLGYIETTRVFDRPSHKSFQVMNSIANTLMFESGISSPKVYALSAGITGADNLADNFDTEVLDYSKPIKKKKSLGIGQGNRTHSEEIARINNKLNEIQETLQGNKKKTISRKQKLYNALGSKKGKLLSSIGLVTAGGYGTLKAAGLMGVKTVAAGVSDPIGVPWLMYDIGKKGHEKKTLGASYDMYKLAQQYQKNQNWLTNEEERGAKQKAIQKKWGTGFIPSTDKERAKLVEKKKQQNIDIKQQLRLLDLTPDQMVSISEGYLKDKSVLDREERGKEVAEQISQLPGFSDIESTDTYDVDERGLNIFKKQEREAAQL